ncbi:MAG TPA: hypothetical protein PK119_00065 [Candidatus Paceibacterota bacterium]|nr:hypothetical protein [Candidatus Paceibacterota bacterium]
MHKKYINQAPFWLLALNKGLKLNLLLFVLAFSFVSRWSGILVEGSPTVFIDENLPFESSNNEKGELNLFLTSFLASNGPLISPKKIEITVTGYSSRPEETDDTPFITASGKVVEDGVAAANFLAFGTKVRFPELFGDKIFVIYDRMHERFSEDRVDIWFMSTEEAKNFGVKKTIMEIIEEKEETTTAVNFNK